MNNQLSSVLLHPQTTVGAQDLISIGGVAHHGFLRKSGQLERALERVPFLTLVFKEAAKWRQRFVILSRGCLYIYNDEFSTSPSQCTSLRGYDSVLREPGRDSSQRKTFRVKAQEHEGMKEYLFGPATDEDRKIWMRKFRAEIQRANEAEPEPDDCDLEYGDLEVKIRAKEPPIPPPRQNRRTQGGQTKAFKNESYQQKNTSNISSEQDDDIDDYDTIKDDLKDEINERNKAAKKRPPQPLPPESKQKATPAKKKESESFTFPGSDRQKVSEILRDKPDGTYAIRQSRSSGCQEVLSVQTTDGMKEYKIFVKDGEYSIDHAKFFRNKEELIRYFSKSALPNRTDTLGKGYSEVFK